MTRDEATLKLMENLDGAMIAIGHVESVLNKVYKDFESRTCDNCKHFQEETRMSFASCENDIFDYIAFPKDFGCNKFERRVE